MVDPATAPDSAERLHQLVELGRIAYSVRDAEIADPAAMRAKVTYLLSDKYAEQLFANFQPDRRNPEVTLPKLPKAGTIYLSVVDRDRLAVSFINSLYYGFGSGIAGEKTGIVLQNRGACFVVEPGHPNCVGPSKLPMHTIIPGAVLNGGRATHVFGVMGGAYQPMGHVHVLTNLFDYGMDIQEAIDAARIFWADDGTLEAESGISDEALAGLRQRGWSTRRGGPWGGAQMIAIDWENGTLCAGSDPRKDGHAAGY
jgi:gamma-glutamyltranspeptidase/glutathione hydrolase